jgi:hypothetical protein
MTDKQDESRGDFSAAGPNDEVISDRVQELTWALLDEQMNDDDLHLLDNLLLSDDKARQSYIGCVQLHADLMAHFAVPVGKGPGTSTQLLSFLSGDSSVGLPSAGGEVVQ